MDAFSVAHIQERPGDSMHCGAYPAYSMIICEFWKRTVEITKPQTIRLVNTTDILPSSRGDSKPAHWP